MMTALVLPSLSQAEDYVPAASGKRFTDFEGPPLRLLTGLYLGVPIFLDVDKDVVRPGAEFGGWLGLDIGWMMFGFGTGLSFNAINLGNIPGGEEFGRSPLTRLFIAPEIRFQVPTKAALPYLAGTFDANWFKHRDISALICSNWYCADRSRFQFAPGFTAKLGVLIKVAKRIYIDVGAKASFTGAGNFFDSTQWWVSPFVGFAYRSGTVED